MSDDSDPPVLAGVPRGKAAARSAQLHGPDPLRDVLKLRRWVRVSVYLAIFSSEPFYFFAMSYSPAQLLAGLFVGLAIAFFAIEGAFNQMIKLRKRSAYPNLLLVEIGGVAETSQAAQRGLEVAASLLGVRVALIGLRGKCGRLLPAARLGLSVEQADEILVRSEDKAGEAISTLHPVSALLAPGQPFHQAFGLVPRGVDRIVFAPVVALGEAIGVIILAADKHAPDARDDQLVSGVGIALGLSLENLRQRDELREGRQRLESVITGAPLVLFALDRDGAYTLVEGRGLDILGSRPEQVLGRSIFDVFKGRPEITDAVKRALAGEEVVASADFSGHIFEAHLTPLRNAAGEVAGVIGVATDISQRRHAEDALRASEERLSTLVANVPVVLFAIDREGNFTLSEGRALADLGLQPGEIVGRNVREVYGDAPAIVANVEMALQGHAVTDTIEVGGLFWETIYSPVRDASGEVTSVIGVAGNVTERINSQEALRASEERYRALVENAGDCIFSVGLDRTVLSVNAAVERIFGYRPEELIGKPIDAIVPPEHRPLLLEMIQRKVQTGGQTAYEIEALRRDGSSVSLEISSWIAREGGQPAAIHGIARDVSERRRAEEAVRRRDMILEAVGFLAGRFLSDDSLEDCMQDALARLGDATGVSRVYVFENETDPGGRVLSNQCFEWVAPGITPQIDNQELQNMQLSEAGMPRFEAELSNGRPVYGHVDEFSKSEQDILVPEDIISIAVVPIFAHNQWWGFIGFDECVTRREWATVEIEALRAAAQLIGAAVQRDRVAEAIRESEERYRELFDNASDIVYTHDLSGRFTSINRTAERITGYSREEAVGLSIARIVAPDHLQKAVDMTRQKLQGGGEHTTYELDIITKSGERVTLELSTRLIIEDGKPAGVQGIARDINARKRAEEALKESEEVYRTLVETSPDAVLLTKASGEIVKANGPAAVLLGVPDAEDLTGLNAISFVDEDDRKRIVADIQSGFAVGVIRNIEYVLQRGDGTRVPVEISLSAITGPEGEPKAFVTVARDITARRKAEEAIRESEEKYRDLVENSNEIIYTLDASGSITYVSPAVRALGGYEPEEVIGQKSLAFVHPDDLADVAASFQRTIAGAPEPSEYRLRKKSGDYMWVQTSSRPIYEGDKVVGLRGLIVDIDKRKQAEEALRESEDRYRELFEDASDLVYEHDLAGRYISVNKAVEQITGYSRDETLKMKWSDVIAEDQRPRLAEIAGSLAAGGGSRSFEIDIVAKDGRRVPLEVRPQVVFRDGKPVAIRGIAREIEERKRIDSALRAIVKGTAADAGDEFFHSLVQQLSGVTGARHALLGRLSGPDSVSVLAFWNGDSLGQTFQYDLKGTPCEDVIDREVCVYPRDVQALFPDDTALVDMGIESYMGAPLFDSAGRPLGLVAVMDVNPMEPSENLRSILAIFAARAGAELERREAEQALRTSEERYRNLVDTAQDVIFTVAQDATLMSLNPAFETVTGWKRENWLGKHFAPLLHPDDLADAYDRFQRVLAGETLAYELRIRKPSGEYIIGEFTSTPLIEGGVTRGTFGIARDVTERKKAEAMIRELAYHDGLTGLPNRALFEDRLGVALAQAHRSRQQLAVMFLDLDRFKVVNDTLGHSGGDRLLKGVARDLKKLVREGDTVARVGGDEFTLLLPGIESQDDATEIAERILNVLRSPRLIDGQEFSVTTSIGVTLYPEDGSDTDTLLRNADTAMYRAKERGRDNFQLYTPAMNAAVLQRLSLENDLRHALDRGELRLYYQPIADTLSGRVVATEALVRWKHPDRGVVSPDEFIPFAEETGLIMPIGEWVLREAMVQNRAWQEAGNHALRISVNLSARQLQQEDIVSTVSSLLRETGMEPEFLQLEITEGAVMKNVDPIIAMLHQIRGMGIGISLDDFGTGYSSLSYLKRFPIDSVKVDRSFVRDIASDPNDAAIVTTVIAMARSLNLQVIAEGVETNDQLEFLRQRGCDQFQGYLISKPAPPATIGRLLQPPARRAKFTRLRSA